MAGLSEAQSEKVQKVAIIIRAIFIIVVRYLENKCGLSVWDGYIVQNAKIKVLTLSGSKAIQRPMMHISLLGHLV